MATKSKIYTIKDLDFEYLPVEIVGLTPLITNRYNKGQTSGKGVEPEDQFKSSLYELPGGKYGFPSAGFKKGIVRAGTYTGTKTLNMKFLMGVLFVTGEAGEFCIIDGIPRMREDSVVIHGSRVLKYRAEFPEWKTKIIIEYRKSLIGPETVYALIRSAGKSCGLGEMRPEKGYTFGRYDLPSNVIEHIMKDA